jgi:hypothetical protein
MYRACYLSNEESEFYKNGTFLFKVNRKRVYFGFRSICEISNEKNEVILSFYSSEFSFFYNELKITKQNLSKELFLLKNKNKFNLILDKDTFELKYNSNPFSNKICEIFINNNLVCVVEKKIVNFKFQFNFNFHEETNLAYYVLIYFAISSVGITDGI